MDGYAVHTADLDETGRASLRLTDVSSAGHPPDWTLQRGEASRIFTGAMLPTGADRVVVQEHCKTVEGHVQISPPTGWKAAYPAQGRG